MQRLRLFLRGLLVGVRTITPYSTIIAIIIAGIFLFVFLRSPAEVLVKCLHAYPGITHAGDNLYVFMRAIDVQSEAVTRPTVFFLGTSAMRESLVSEGYLTDALASRGTRFNVVDLTSWGQPFWHGQQLIETAAGNRQGLVVLAVNRARIIYPPYDYRRGQIFELTAGSSRSLTDIKNRAAFLNQIIIRNYLHQDIHDLVYHGSTNPRINYDYYEGRHRFTAKPDDPQYRSEHVKKTVTRFLHEETNTYDKEFAEAIIRLKKKLNSSGKFTFILVDTPRHPALDTVPEMKLLYKKHRAWMMDIATKIDAELVVLPERVDYAEQDFNDAAHLRTLTAIERTSDVLVGAIIKVWEERKCNLNQ